LIEDWVTVKEVISNTDWGERIRTQIKEKRREIEEIKI